jgi:predicted signal transduction protein with EAL and GGDEF domain
MLLVEFARRVQGHVRQSDTLARMGGDEFALIATELADPRAATVIAQKLLDAFSTPFRIAGHELFVTGSIGIAYYPQDAADASSLQKNADLALYRAKAMGRNRHECFSADMLTATGERLALDNALRRALTADEMRLYYQPQFDAYDRLVGLESLVRWEHPILGLLPPARFISLSEETGFILHIGEWVLNEACRQARKWQDAGLPRIRVGVNVSALQLAQSEFVNSVEAALKRHNLPAQWLEIEITESLLMRNPRETAAKLEQISALGVGVALDDFGTGYSSLAYLQHLPIHKLKIDRSFVRQLGGAANPANNMAVIRAIISLGNSLGMNVIAEGVETEQQRDLLRKAGCGMMQGFLYGQPQPGPEIEHVLMKATKAAA